MDAETETILLSRWSRDGDLSARNRLVAAQQAFVARVAKRHGRSAQLTADLIQEGNVGLLHAVDRFDPERGVRLSTFAAWWIRAFVLRHLEYNRGLVRGATTASRSRVFYQLERTRQRLAADGEAVSREAVAHALGVDVSDVAAVEALRTTASLDTTISGDDGPRGSAVDRVIDRHPRPDEQVEADDMRECLEGALRQFQRGLKGRRLEMFRERVASPRPASLQELGERWGITRTAARRIEAGVARPLQRHLLRVMGDSVTLALGPA